MVGKNGYTVYGDDLSQHSSNYVKKRPIHGVYIPGSSVLGGMGRLAATL